MKNWESLRFIKQEYERLKVKYSKLVLPAQESTEHHALNDALWTKKAWTVLKEVENLG